MTDITNARASGASRLSLTGVERHMKIDEIIVSKTDPRGLMTYVNDVFMDISGYTEDELIGKPHSFIRHPHMPRSVFKLLWGTISSGEEIFAYVNNRCKNGDNYWVFAHVTPTFDQSGKVIGYHSNRRKPKDDALQTIRVLYRQLLEAEQAQPTSEAALRAGVDLLNATLKKAGKNYDEFILSL